MPRKTDSPFAGNVLSTRVQGLTRLTSLRRRDFLKTTGLAVTRLVVTNPLTALSNFDTMKDSDNFDVIIIGGSYSGLSAAMALGRSLRSLLVIDSGHPCNWQTPRSHNFITHDGAKPSTIVASAKAQILNYSTVKFISDLAVSGKKIDNGFEITTKLGNSFKTRKLIFATGVRDIMPEIDGFSECWGISIIHCPYCHGYEVRNEITGFLANGDAALHYAKLVMNLSKKLTIFTNGKASFTNEEREKLSRHSIKIVEKEVLRFEHTNGYIESIVFKDESSTPLKALYAKLSFAQHSDIPENLGCTLFDQGLIKVDTFQKTSVDGVYACGDNSSFLRSVANAVATGNFTGAAVNSELCDEEFN